MPLARRTPARLALRTPLHAIAAALLAACGGGGGDEASYSLSVTPAALEFAADANGMLPNAKSLSVVYEGDGLLAGYPPGMTPPGWLDMDFVASTATTATLVVRVTTSGLAPGEYRTTVRLLTGKEDGTHLVTRDVPVRYLVGPARIGLVASPAAFAFEALDGAAPAAQTLTFASDVVPDSYGLSVESVAGGPTDWLALSATSGALVDGAAQVEVAAAPRPPGSYAATLVVRNGAGETRARIPITYEVAPVVALGGGLSARVTEGAGVADLERSFTVDSLLDAAAGAGYRWALASDADWVTVSPASGDLSADTPIVVRLDPDRLWALENGTHSAALTLTFTQGGATAASVPVALDLALQPALGASNVELALRAGATGADLLSSVAVTGNLGEAFASRGGWTAASSAAWIAAAPAGGGAALELALQPAALAELPNGAYQATVAIQPADGRVAGTAVEASLALALPDVRHVAPSATWVERGEDVTLRGSGFGDAGTTLPVSFGGQPVEGSVVGDTEVRVTAPSQATPGPVAVTIENDLGIARGTSTLKVLPEPGYAAHTAPLAKAFRRLTLDPERSAVLLSGWGTDELRRLRFVDGAWAEDALPLPNATSVAVTLDGGDLIATAGSLAEDELFLRLDPDTFAIRHSVGYADHYAMFDIVAPLNDGRILILDSNQWVDTLWYPELTQGPYVSVPSPWALVTRDRSRVVLGSPYGAASYDAAEGVFRDRTLAQTVYAADDWAISGDGGRLLVRTAVHGRDFQYLGALVLPEPNLYAVALGPDGAFAYTLARNAAGTGWVFRRTDVRPAGPSYASDATPLPLALPAAEWPAAMAVSEDGGTLFVLTTPESGEGSVFHALPLP